MSRMDWLAGLLYLLVVVGFIGLMTWWVVAGGLAADG